MVKKLNSAEPGFEAAFTVFAGAARGEEADVAAAVGSIIADVRARGFPAVADCTRRFDGFELTDDAAAVAPKEIDAAERLCDPDALAALDLAAARIRDYHERQRPENQCYTDEAGITLGWRWTPVDAAGLYAPGGRAAYPSSVLMNAIPAAVAGVKNVRLCVPAPGGEINPLVLAAARRAGVTEIFRIGGAQAIAALAYGAGPVRPVDVIVGPGNAYVAEAKRQVFGHVGIDSIAGPSEILVVADTANDPRWIAADLLSQAEHDPSSQSVLLTDDDAFASLVEAAIETQLKESPRRDIASAAWRDNSAIIILRSLDEAPELVDRLAPEHLELAVEDPERLFARIRHAGAVFLGRHAPEALGDYLAGPNHVLPTGRAARYASGLSVLNFMKRSSIIGCGPEGLAAIGPAAAILADSEGLPSHARSVLTRLGKTR